MINRQRGAFRRCGNGLATAAVTAVLSSFFVPAAHAADAAWMSEEASEAAAVLNNGVAPDGKTTWGQTLQISGPGKLTVSAYDLGVPMTLMDRLDSLSFSISNSTSIFGSHSGDGSMNLDLKGPGEYFVNFSATPSALSRFKLPLVSWSVSFVPNASAVPLPATVWLLIGGLAWAIGMQRKRAKLALAGRDGGDSLRWETAPAPV
jgi:hypothetical protein